MSDQHDLMVIKIAAYYNQECNSGDNLHPKIEELKKFLAKNIRENELDIFYDKIISHSNYFPTKPDLSEIYNSFRLFYPENDCDDSDADKQRTKAIDQFLDDSGEVLQNCSIEDMLKDDTILSPDQMKKKYGLEKCKELWYYEGVYEINLISRGNKYSNNYNID